jgi:hypothetical protein
MMGILFERVKQCVSAQEAAERYGLKLTRNGMACCPFHPDRHPSMKVDERYYCFGCGATGDAIDLTAKLLGLRPKEAALQLAADFNIPVDEDGHRWQKPRRRVTPKGSDEKAEEIRCFRALNDYCHRLAEWEELYRPGSPEEEWHPLFTESLQQREYMEYLIEKLIAASPQERRALVVQLKGRVAELEQRFQGGGTNDG